MGNHQYFLQRLKSSTTRSRTFNFSLNILEFCTAFWLEFYLRETQNVIFQANTLFTVWYFASLLVILSPLETWRSSCLKCTFFSVNPDIPDYFTVNSLIRLERWRDGSELWKLLSTLNSQLNAFVNMKANEFFFKLCCTHLKINKWNREKWRATCLIRNWRLCRVWFAVLLDDVYPPYIIAFRKAFMAWLLPSICTFRYLVVSIDVTSVVYFFLKESLRFPFSYWTDLVLYQICHERVTFLTEFWKKTFWSEICSCKWLRISMVHNVVQKHSISF